MRWPFTCLLTPRQLDVLNTFFILLFIVKRHQSVWRSERHAGCAGFIRAQLRDGVLLWLMLFNDFLLEKRPCLLKVWRDVLQLMFQPWRGDRCVEWVQTPALFFPVERLCSDEWAEALLCGEQLCHKMCFSRLRSAVLQSCMWTCVQTRGSLNVRIHHTWIPSILIKHHVSHPSVCGRCGNLHIWRCWVKTQRPVFSVCTFILEGPHCTSSCSAVCRWS